MKKSENLYAIISNLIGSGKIESAITYLSEINTNSNEVVLIKSRFSDLESEKRRGIISQEYYTLQKNIISNSILEIARKHSSRNDDSNKKNKKERGFIFWMKFATPILIIGLISYVVVNVKLNNRQLNKDTSLANTPLIKEKPGIEKIDSNTTTVLKSSKDTFSSNASIPAFEFEKIEVDLGKIKAGTRIEHDIHFISSGDSPLVISTVKGSCGCLIAKSDKSVYLPGESGIITLSLDTSNRNGKSNFKISIQNNSKVSPYFLKVNSEIFI